jgi:hypothetical protein
MKKVRIYLLTVCACAALFACNKPEPLEIIPDYNFTNKLFQFEATVPTQDDESVGFLVESGNDGLGRLLNIYVDKACCNMAPEVMLELNHVESGDMVNPDVEGTLVITADSDNCLYATYSGTGVRTDCQCALSCDMTTILGRGIFCTEKTNLNLDIKGVFEEGNPEPVAYKVNIVGYLRIPKAGN